MLLSAIWEIDMWQRIRQFFAAISAEITPDDCAMVSQYLNRPEQDLFWRMNLPDQQHSIRVACSALTLAADSPQPVDVEMLIKAALLHDSGKEKGDVSTFDKVLAVLLHAAMGDRARDLAKPGRGSRLDNIRHALYIYFHHPERSAAKIRTAGSNERISAIVAQHHNKNLAKDASPELILLQKADEMN